MFKNALWKNPIGWTQKTVGTKLRFFIVLVGHIVMGLAIAAIIIYQSIAIGLMTGNRLPISFTFTIGLFLGMTIALPPFYLYAMKKLLGKIKELKKDGKL